MQFDHLYMIRRHDSVLILGLFLLNNKQQQLTALRKFSVSEELFTPENIFVIYLAFMICGGKLVPKVSVYLI